jgi:HEAT repeat protein
VAFALGQIARSPAAGAEGRQALDVLVAGLAHGQLRAAAREALAAAGPVAVPALVAHLEGKLDGDPATAVLLLRDLADRRATPVLIAELSRGRLSRELVLDALGQIGDERALVPVLGLLGDSDPAVRLAAMRALRPLIGRGSRSADVLKDMLDDPDLEIRILAAEYLGLMQAESAVPRLVAMAAAGHEVRLRAAAVAALGEIGDPGATPALLILLEKGPASLKIPAGNALIYVQDPKAVGPLLQLVDRTDARSRQMVVRTLGGVLRDQRNDRARRALERLARDARLEVGLAAIAALGAMGDSKSAGALLDLIGGGQFDRRRAAIEAVANLKDPPATAVPVLDKQLVSTDDRIAAAAAWALGKLGSKGARQALRRACKRRGFATPVNASAAFALLASEADGPALIDLLHHPNRLVRVNAAAGAGRLELAAARPRLERQLARDPSYLVRQAAARALSRIGGAREALTQAAASDPRAEVRDAAKSAFKPPPRTDWRNFYFVDPTRGDQPVEQEPYFTVAADGLATAFYTDARGEAVEERFPPGPALLAPAAQLTEH